MPREPKPPPQEEEQGAPEWMVTFSDCMTLLLTFFVLLLTFSSFDDRIFRKLNVIYSEAFNTIDSRTRINKEAYIDFTQHQQDEIEGSNRPTYEIGLQGHLKESQKPEFQEHKIFAIPSGEVFLGKGVIISPQGQQALAALGEFLKLMPGQIIISEVHRLDIENEYGPDVSMARALQVAELFSKNYGISQTRLNISTGNMSGNNAFDALGLDKARTQDRRILEIALIDRSIYN
ncbi:MAG: flagellar motor protein MotB [Phycisphaerae bacterium]